MATRKFYFLRDSLTGLYYTNADITLYTWDENNIAVCNPKDSYHTFENAVIFTSKHGVKAAMKKRCSIWRRYLKTSDEDAKRAQWVGLQREMAREREKLPNFGIEIVTVEASDGT